MGCCTKCTHNADPNFLLGVSANPNAPFELSNQKTNTPLWVVNPENKQALMGSAAAVGGASVGGDGGDGGGCDVGVAAGGEWHGSGVGEMMMRLRWCVGGGDVMDVVAAWSGGASVGGGR
ncbi:hypothetical protein Tco_0900709 [Tanacetum coccineum]